MSRFAARYAQLIKMCRRRGCSSEDAKELVQEAHLRFFEYEQSTIIRDVDSLLRRIVINLSITHYHRELSRPYVSSEIEKLDRRGMLIEPTPGPERILAAEQQLDGVVNLLSAASERTCQIFVAQRGGYSYEEIAVAFAVRPRTVEKHLASAILMLREMMPSAFPGP
jgi:RNA polymerase sigma factor (sigma-70 family)